MQPEFTTELMAICRLVGLFERDFVCCGDVTVSQCVALQKLLSGPRDVSTLARELGITVSASTRLLDGISRRGWLERHRDPEDRRRVLVDLSPQGRQQATELQTQTRRSVDAVLDKIPETDRAQVLKSMALIRGAVEASILELQQCCDPSLSCPPASPDGGGS